MIPEHVVCPVCHEAVTKWPAGWRLVHRSKWDHVYVIRWSWRLASLLEAMASKLRA